MEKQKLIFRLHIPFWNEDDHPFTIIGKDAEETLPFVTGYVDGSQEIIWNIDIETGKVLEWNGNAVYVFDKLRDNGTYELVIDDEVIRTLEGYVPDFCCIGENGYGDYIKLDVDADGCIRGWNNKLKDECLAFFDVITLDMLARAGGLEGWYAMNYNPHEEGRQLIRPNLLLISDDGRRKCLGDVVENFLKGDEK